MEGWSLKIFIYFREYKEGDRTRVETTYSYSKYGVCVCFHRKDSLLQKCPYLEFFWSVFSAFELNTD